MRGQHSEAGRRMGPKCPRSSGVPPWCGRPAIVREVDPSSSSHCDCFRKRTRPADWPCRSVNAGSLCCRSRTASPIDGRSIHSARAFHVRSAGEARLTPEGSAKHVRRCSRLRSVPHSGGPVDVPDEEVAVRQQLVRHFVQILSLDRFHSIQCVGLGLDLDGDLSEDQARIRHHCYRHCSGYVDSSSQRSSSR